MTTMLQYREHAAPLAATAAMLHPFITGFPDRDAITSLEFSCDPFGPSFDEPISLSGPHPTAGLDLIADAARGHPRLRTCLTSSPAARIPCWRSRIHQHSDCANSDTASTRRLCEFRYRFYATVIRYRPSAPASASSDKLPARFLPNIRTVRIPVTLLRDRFCTPIRTLRIPVPHLRHHFALPPCHEAVVSVL